MEVRPVHIFLQIAVSQFISNVPAAMLLAAFSQQREALLLGVNVGGLGTLIASMASRISKLPRGVPCAGKTLFADVSVL